VLFLSGCVQSVQQVIFIFDGTMKASKFVWDSKTKCIRDRSAGRAFKGVHRLIEDKFIPAGSTFSSRKHRVWYKKNRKKDKENFKIGRIRVRKGKASSKAVTSGLMAAGIATNRTAKGMGSHIDTQIGRLIEASGGDPDVLRIWTHSGDQRLLVPKGVKMPRKPNLNKHPYVDLAIQTLLKAGLVPIAAQPIVGSIKRGIATMLDIVCMETVTVRETIKAKERETKHVKRLAVIELKAGYEGTWDAVIELPKAKGETKKRIQCLEAPLQEVADTLHNRAFLQAYLGALLLQGHDDLSYTPRSFVLHIDRYGPKLEEVPDSIKKQRVGIVGKLVK
jgi:hypothetical protein